MKENVQLRRIYNFSWINFDKNNKREEGCEKRY